MSESADLGQLLEEGAALVAQLPSLESQALGMELLGSAEKEGAQSPLAGLLWEQWKCLAANDGMSEPPDALAVPVAEGCVRRVKLAATIVSGSDMPKVGCARRTHTHTQATYPLYSRTRSRSATSSAPATHS